MKGYVKLFQAHLKRKLHAVALMFGSRIIVGSFPGAEVHLSAFRREKRHAGSNQDEAESEVQE